ncbi:hypothetical protein [Fusobacterium perfoetens]|uniref:hypothetical protein n=1 Tax=Fusobacterium perfoetens TaxID=852 RepID=UPI000484D591|nr:hypothetical protein [Fusobacterium perfoetens]MCI6152815.1 hypothetical protein [Fusobacterium perfoetens]MDY3236709.1 hypothetical protein [Fusobacterium perfoetens]
MLKILKPIFFFVANTIIGIAVCFLFYKEFSYLFEINNIVNKTTNKTEKVTLSFLDNSKIIREIKIDKSK